MRDPLRYLGEYVTRKRHVDYPAGTPCRVYRDYYDHLVLKLYDGKTLEFERFYFARGLENRD